MHRITCVGAITSSMQARPRARHEDGASVACGQRNDRPRVALARRVPLRGCRVPDTQRLRAGYRRLRRPAAHRRHAGGARWRAGGACTAGAPRRGHHRPTARRPGLPYPARPLPTARAMPRLDTRPTTRAATAARGMLEAGAGGPTWCVPDRRLTVGLCAEARRGREGDAHLARVPLWFRA